MGDDIASALKNKNRGRGGFKFVFSVKYYTGFFYSVECSADTNAGGKRIPRVSDGNVLLKAAVDSQGRDLFDEINSLTITAHPECPHDIIVAEVELNVARELERSRAAQLAFDRLCEEKTILANKKEEEKKRKRAASLKAAEDAKAQAAVSESSSSTVQSKKKNKKENITPKGIKVKNSRRRRGDAGESSDSDNLEDVGAITLSGYIGGVNDVENLRHAGRHKPVATGNLDSLDQGYDDVDDSIVRNLRGAGKEKDAYVVSLKNFILRGGQVPALSETDKVWSDSDNRPKPKMRSQLDGLSFDKCEGVGKQNNRLLVSNSIDIDTSSEEESDESGVRAARSSPKRGSKSAKRRKKKNKSVTKVGSKPKSRDKLDFLDNEASVCKSSSSSDTDVPKRKAKPAKSLVAPAAADVTAGDDEVKPRKAREAFGLSEQQVTQYGNMNLVPFQTTAAQRQSARLEMFEVDGRLMSEDDIKSLIFEDREILSKNLDTKFLSFVRQHIMVDVFKDVHFLTNVIDFYRLKRQLHATQPGEHIVCVWQTVLEQVASDLINELVVSNNKLLEQMDRNLLDLKEFRKQTRLANDLSIGSVNETERIEADLADLKVYKTQMKLNKKALQDIGKVMKRRVISTSHSLGAKIACVWAKLNGFQHLLRNQMSRFEKKFLLDPSMPFYSVLSDDLSRQWGNVATSPRGLFLGIDLAGSNGTSVTTSTEFPNSGRVEMDEEPSVEMSSVPMGVASSRAQLDYQDAHVSSNSTSPPHSCNVEISGSGLSFGPMVRFDGGSSGGLELQDSVDRVVALSTDDENETARQEAMVEEEERNDESFQSPLAFSLSPLTGGDPQNKLDPYFPGRPSKGTYTSALLNGSQSGSPNSSQLNSSPSRLEADVTERHVTASRYRTPLVITSSKRAKAAALESNASYLSSISTLSSASSGSPNDICASNTAVLFDELKHMSQDTSSVESMKRFIEVMNEKPSNVPMPTTKAQEDEILKKAKTKKQKEEVKAAAAAEAAKNAVAAASSHGPDIELSSADEGEGDQQNRVVRQKTDSYALVQKLFLFVCKKHVEVKDCNLNLQFFGQRLVRTLSNSSLLKFLLLIIRNRVLNPAHLVVYLMDEKSVFSEFKCLFGVAYDTNDYNNISADGYCIPRSMFVLRSNEQCGYNMSVAAMSTADRLLFRSSDSRREFYGFLNATRESIGTHCADETVKEKDKKKLRTLMTLFGAFPQLKQVPAAYWACLDWVAYANFNCTAFSTNYSDCVPGYAQMHCSSSLRRDMSSATALAPYSLSDIHRVLTEPAAPNFCVLEGQHAFVVRNPAKEAVIASFKSVLGLFLSACQQNVIILADKSGVDVLVVEDILEKMIQDNAYTLSEVEATLMGEVIKNTDDGAAATADGVVIATPDVIVICEDDRVPTLVNLDHFRESRSNTGETIDLCDSDTGDMDRVKARAARAHLARNQQELVELHLKVCK
jgi:hypothetical protein